MSLPIPPGLNGSAGPPLPAGHAAPLSGAQAFPHLVDLAIARQLPAFGWAEAVPVLDAELDHYQRDAVARAMATPDFLLIQGPVGTGKSRVAVEIARQAAARGRRVLWLSPARAGVEGAVRRLAGCPDVSVRRLLGPAESIETLAPACRDRTAEWRERSLLAARTAELHHTIAEAEDRLVALEPLATVLAEARRVAPLLAEKRAELAALTARRDALPQETERDIAEPGDSPSYLVQRLRKLDQQRQKEVADRDGDHLALSARETAAKQSRDAAAAELELLRPKTEAVKSGGLFSLAKWKAKLDGTLPARQAAAEQQLREAEATMAAVAAEANLLAEAERNGREDHAGKRAKFLAEEMDRRAKELDQRIAEASAAAAAQEVVHQEQLARLTAAGLSDPSLPEDDVAREATAARQRLEDARAAETRLAADGTAALAAWKATAAIVIGPIDALSAVDAENFDLLIVDDADGLPEADIAAAARLAPRWVFLGAPPERPLRNTAPRPEFWGRLWHAVHHPRTWVTEGEHLVCRLHPLTAAERRKCDREPVADNPSIELRLAAFMAEPVLAEVAFPANCNAPAAREYLFRELDELTIQPATHTPAWETAADRVTCRFTPPDAAAGLARHPGGVTEEVLDLDTLAIHFAAADGWTPDTAREWLAARGLKRSPGRAVALRRAQRACPGLARWLNEAFRIGYHHPAEAGPDHHVEFLAVPDLRGRRDAGPARRAGGAGYEIALHEPRQRGLLTDDWSGALPDWGFVNLPEAQALVQFLENHPAPSVIVTSPFPAQVAVLRRLFAKSRAANVRVIDPAEADAAECDWLAISLTRSHVSRAVTFGESPAVLRKLVGCARRKILFAGDPGTLSRRLQWEGPVDHLDGAEAAHERAWVAALADCPRVSPSRHRPSPTSA